MKFFFIYILVSFTGFESAEVEPEFDTRIYNGQDAAVDQFSYQVSILLNFPNGVFICGGSLIGHTWVLTAAHCTAEAISVRILLGDVRFKEAEVNHTISKEHIHIHPDWNNKLFSNDISLIEIPKVEYSNKIQAIKLPAKSSNYSSYDGEKAIASGWGDTFDFETEVPHVLQWASMSIVPNDECTKTYGPVVTPAKICVSTAGSSSTCKGDSGGPLVLEKTNVQIGLTSFGSKRGCSLGIPVVFERLTSHLDWIKNITGISS